MGTKSICHLDMKNQLPAEFSDEIFYGKIPGGLAVRISLEYFRTTHYPAYHREITPCPKPVRKGVGGTPDNQISLLPFRIPPGKNISSWEYDS